MSIVKGTQPDLTPGALTALAAAVVADLVVLFKLDLTDAQQAAVNGLLAAAVTVGFFVHDAWLRSGRNKRLAAERSSAAPVTYTSTGATTGGPWQVRQAASEAARPGFSVAEAVDTYLRRAGVGEPTRAAGVEDDDPQPEPTPRANDTPD